MFDFNRDSQTPLKRQEFDFFFNLIDDATGNCDVIVTVRMTVECGFSEINITVFDKTYH